MGYCVSSKKRIDVAFFFRHDCSYMRKTLKLSPDQMLGCIRERVGLTSQKRVAAGLGITPQFLNDVLRGRRDVSENLAMALGYRRCVYFERVGTAKVP